MSLLTTQVRKGFIFLFSTPNFRSSSSVNPLIAYVYKPFKRYSKESRSCSHNVEERAPSTAEEFKRVAEEKLRAAKQGVASQTSEKLYDGAEEATIGDSKSDSIKNRIKEHEQGAD
ncbi:hypothetical protein Ddye_027612 [Dipteronia dyeriana]|uniref:Uncharacterized protein n=1 Tax=Dipteronia dyeriana TaxID=168575 RepID=A0AAD9TPH2_9ROSI|nr:hypothetical protein Ddye_027612 [Dipteronia dyeriana]